jgi:hypothetical protein
LSFSFQNKTKSTATEVAAPKNANSNCRYTKTNKMDETPHQFAELAFLPNSINWCKIKMGTKPPSKNKSVSPICLFIFV